MCHVGAGENVPLEERDSLMDNLCDSEVMNHKEYIDGESTQDGDCKFSTDIT